MALSEFITVNKEAILSECEAFARTLLPAAADMDTVALRDHAAQVLAAIAADMLQPQTKREQHDKAQGNAPQNESGPNTAAEIHGALRAAAGFDVNQTTAEFRALRASVTRLWFESGPKLGRDEVFELVRFNESMDQALAESILYFAAEAAHMRNLFLGVLSHELRTPLSTIVASAHSLGLATRQNKHLPDAVDRIARGGKRIESLLNDLLDYVRSGLGEGMRVTRVNVDLGQVCGKVIGELQGLHPGRTIEVEHQGDLHCECDEQRVAQALSNLISNAIRYGDVTAPVKVTLSGDAPQDVVVSVHNTGPGIPPATRDSLFEPLVRGTGTANSGFNLGLGLYVVREIALAHGGEATAESSDTDGTTFRIRLPRRAQGEQPAAFKGLRMN